MSDGMTISLLAGIEEFLRNGPAAVDFRTLVNYFGFGIAPTKIEKDGNSVELVPPYVVWFLIDSEETIAMSEGTDYYRDPIIQFTSVSIKTSPLEALTISNTIAELFRANKLTLLEGRYLAGTVKNERVEDNPDADGNLAFLDIEFMTGT